MPAYDTEVEWGRLPAAAIRRRAEADAIVLIPIASASARRLIAAAGSRPHSTSVS